jgi:membrane protease YdiL (CAAX protease family)
MPFAPAIAAVVVRRWVTREGFRDSGLRPNLRRWRFYLLAVSWPIFATLLSVPLALLFRTAPGGFTMPWGMEAPEPLTLLGWMLFPILASPVFFGEEFGWRGYLQVRLFPDNPWAAAVATGMIWGAWHYPWILASDQAGEEPVLWLLLFTVATTNASVFFGWLRLRTGDVWSASVGHGANNIVEDSWHRLTFTGDRSGTPALSGDLTVVIAEMIVLSGTVAVATLRRRRWPLRSRDTRERMAPQPTTAESGSLSPRDAA